jgi:hypothetical protein
MRETINKRHALKLNALSRDSEAGGGYGKEKPHVKEVPWRIGNRVDGN